MGLIVSMGEDKPSKSSVTLIQDLRKFLRTEIYPYIKDEMAADKLRDFLEEESDEIKKYWDRHFEQEDADWWKKWNK